MVHHTIIKLRCENADKDAEIAQLRAENTRLKQERMAMRLPGPRERR